MKFPNNLVKTFMYIIEKDQIYFKDFAPHHF